MNQLFGSLAFIKTYIDSGKTIWDALIPLIGKLIIENNITNIETETLCTLFRSNYNFSIPIHPMQFIINRMMSKNLISKHHTANISLIKTISSITLPVNVYSEIIEQFRTYLKQHFQSDYTQKQCEEIIIGYLSAFDTEILIALNQQSVLPQVKFDSHDQYRLNKFVNDEILIDENKMKIFENIIVANIFINSIFYSNKTKKLNLNKVTVYLDTRIVLRLAGVEGKFRKDEYEKYVQMLLDCSSKLRIFEEHYNEIHGIIQDCINRLSKGLSYDPKYASPAFTYFIENKYQLSDIIEFKAEIDQILKKYKIAIDDYEYDKDDERTYLIDEKKLYDSIVQCYREGKYNFEEHSKEKMIWTDIKAISAIFRKRKGLRPNTLENVKFVFLTTNTALSRAVRLFSLTENEYYQYQECLTDTFWGTILWLNNSYFDTTYFRNKIIADVIAQIQLDSKIKSRFIVRLKELKKSGKINEETFFFLRSHNLPLQMLADITNNDDNLFTDKLPEEILEEFKHSISKPLIDNIADRDSKIEYYQNQNMRQINKIYKIANIISRGILLITGLFVILPSILLMIFDIFAIPGLGKVVIYIASITIELLLIYELISLKMIGNKIRASILKIYSKQWYLDLQQ